MHKGQGLRQGLRMLLGAGLLGLAGLGAAPLWAEVTVPPALTTQARKLSETLLLPGIVDVMRAEGVDYGKQLQDEMFPGRGGPDWDASVARIYDPAVLLRDIENRLAQELAAHPQALSAAQAFFGSPTGQKILSLELEARRALLDEATEAAAREAAADLETQAAPRVEALRRFVATNDLIEMNVMGGLNANFAFYKGLAEGGALDGQMSEADMLSEVWSQEAQVRADAEEWLWPYLTLAYQPLSDEEMQAYQAFSETEAGRQLNAALFAAFDASFVRVSRDLGRAAARMVQGEDI